MLDGTLTRVTRDELREFLERLYKHYPKKQGKSLGMFRLLCDIETREDCQAFARALGRFIEHHRNARTEARYIPHFKSFALEWRDWAEEDAGETVNFSGDDDLFRGI